MGNLLCNSFAEEEGQTRTKQMSKNNYKYREWTGVLCRVQKICLRGALSRRWGCLVRIPVAVRIISVQYFILSVSPAPLMIVIDFVGCHIENTFDSGR